MMTTLFWLFLIGAAINLFFWIGIFSELAFSSVRSDTGDRISQQMEAELVSVVVCVRNEAEKVENLLNRILNQTYRSYEIIVVNDNSTDNTLEVLHQIKKSCHNFRLLIIDNKVKMHPGKKEALALGLDRAKGSIILLTDADCVPASGDWIRSMVLGLRGKQIGLGFSPYLQERGFLNRFIRMEAVYTAIQYLSFASAGFPYMGVGRNLVFRRSVVGEEHPFEGHLDLASGDDDLFVSERATPENTLVILDPKSFVYSQPSSSWGDYYRQKKRHYTTGTRYRLTHQVLLGSLAVSHIIFFLGGIALIGMQMSAAVVSIIIILRLSVVGFLYARILEKLGEQDLRPWVLLFDLLLVGYYLLFSMSLLPRKKQKWN